MVNSSGGSMGFPLQREDGIKFADILAKVELGAKTSPKALPRHEGWVGAFCFISAHSWG